MFNIALIEPFLEQGCKVEIFAIYLELHCVGPVGFPVQFLCTLAFGVEFLLVTRRRPFTLHCVAVVDDAATYIH